MLIWAGTTSANAEKEERWRVSTLAIWIAKHEWSSRRSSSVGRRMSMETVSRLIAGVVSE